MSGKHRDKPGQLLDFPPHLVSHREATPSVGPWVARSDELFSLRVSGSLIRILLLMVITAASHAMCDAELASDWSGLTGHGPWLAADMLHDARQILSPPGNDRVGVGCAPDTWHVTHIVTLRRHTINGQWTGSCRERGTGGWPIRSQGWALLTNQMRRVTVRHSRVKQGARWGQERTGAVAGAADAKRYSRFYLRTENTLDYCSAPDKEWQSFLGKKIELDWLMSPDCPRNGWQSHQTLSHYLTETSEPSYVDISSVVRQD